jgi:hypothetical protein
VIKTKTAQGFVPNFSSAGQKSLDRTEPMIGGKVLLDLYNKYKDKWIVELLFDDILDWHNWFHAYRRLPPKELVCLGSEEIRNNVSAKCECEGVTPVYCISLCHAMSYYC